MFSYIIKRILIFVPTIFVVSVLTFVISINTPGDPVDSIINRENSGQSASMSLTDSEKNYEDIRRQLRLNLPVFYFSISNRTYCDTLYRIPKRTHREALERLSFDYGNWELVSNFYLQIRGLINLLETHPINSDNTQKIRQAKTTLEGILVTHHVEKIEKDMGLTKALLGQIDGSLEGKINPSITALEQLVAEKTRWRRYVPQLNFYGFNNQYHLWLFGNDNHAGFIRGDFGVSYFSKRPVSSMVWEAIKLTFSLSFIAIFMTYLVAIPLGIHAAVNKGKTQERIVSTGLFMLYSMPNFLDRNIVGDVYVRP
jgi:peptide/nickel transport system permease protein